jgi:hypothetical protein
VHVEETHGRAVRGAVAREIIEIEHGDFSHALMQLAEPRGNEGLALLGVFVLCVFGQIAVSASLHELFGQLVVEFVFELGDFVLQFFLELFANVSHFFLAGAVLASEQLLSA